MASIEAPAGSDFYWGSADLSNAFYCMGVPTNLSSMFSLTPIRASHTDVTILEGTPVTPEEWLLPCLTILPMGWAWSLHLCQRVVSGVVERFIPQDSMVDDKRAGVQLREPEAVCGAAYVDNYGVQ